MKKIIALLTLSALAIWTLGPALTVANTTVSTGLTKGSGGGTAPIVKAKWEMKTGTPGQDDSSAAGAQFLAPGIWGSTLNYTVCAIATDKDEVNNGNIAGVYAEIFYPVDRAYNENPACLDEHPTSPPDGSEDYGIGACGVYIEQNPLIQLTKAQGYELFCNQVKNNNNNLPVFESPYTYDEICAVDGELMKEEAYVYCADKTLEWEDPAGLYTVVAYAQDKNNNSSNWLENSFEYLPTTSFAKDFTEVNYGDVFSLSTRKKVSGDLNFGTADKPTIRNLGNTRLWMSVAQDDMDFGMSNGWNIDYDARVGNNEADWKIYDPFGFAGATPVYTDYTQLEDILELSETEEMDFSVHVKKWPNNTSYSGTMWLVAEMAPFRICNSCL